MGVGYGRRVQGVVAYEAEVMEKAMDGDIMSARERREFLAKLVRDGRDGSGMSTTTRYVDEDGREKMVVAAPDFKDQLRAVELDAKLSGDLVAGRKGRRSGWRSWVWEKE